MSVVLRKAILPREVRRTVPYVVQHARVVIIKDDTQPPVMRRDRPVRNPESAFWWCAANGIPTIWVSFKGIPWSGEEG